MKHKIADFEILYLGITSPDYFQGFGVWGSGYEHATYGIGTTHREAIEDMMESVAQHVSFDTEGGEEFDRRVYDYIQQNFNIDVGSETVEIDWEEYGVYFDENGEPVDEDGEPTEYPDVYIHWGIRYNVEDLPSGE